MKKIPETDLDDSGFFGVLSDISLEDYIQLICMKNTTKAIRVVQQDEKGLIFIEAGKVIFASQGQLHGVEALQEILSWKKGSFREVRIKKIPLPNIDSNYRPSFLGVADAGEKKTPQKTPSDIPTGQASRKNPVRKNRTLMALTAVLPICFLAVLFLVFNFTDKNPLIAFATTSPHPQQASVVANSTSALPEAPTGDKKKTEATTPSIAIGPLVKAEGKRILPEETILRLHGSNTIGAKLAPALVSGYLTSVLAAEKVEQLPGKQDNEVVLKAKFKDVTKVIEIDAHGSTTGFKGLAAEQCEIGMASRKIKDKEITELSKFGDMTAPSNEHVIALDGIAVIVNKGNKINTITMQDLADIFSGKTTNWSQLGGDPGEITVYARDDNSGTYDTFKSIVLDKLELKPGAKRFESNPELSEQVSRDPSAIGFTSLPSIGKAKAIAVANTGAKAILPSFFTVATEDYPIARRLYLYTATNPKNPHVRDFLEFVHSRQGQEITNKIDLVDMNIKTFNSEKTDLAQIKNLALVEDYLKATDNAQRLSLNFRFNTGKVTLDNRGERDLNRVVDFLKERLDRKIVLAGFADNAGDYEVNLKLAKIRAETVAEQLRARGIAVHHIASGGEELPVATNLSAAGKEKNRRVEVWLK